MNRYLIILFAFISNDVLSQLQKVKLIPSIESNYSFYRYANKNTKNIKYAYSKINSLQSNFNWGGGFEFEFAKIRVGVIVETGKLAWGYKEENKFVKLSGIGFDKTRNTKLFFSKELFQCKKAKFRNIFSACDSVQNNRPIRVFLLGNISRIKCMRQYGPPNDFLFMIDSNHNYFIFEKKVIRENAFSAGVGISLCQYFKNKECFRLTFGYDQGFLRIINTEFKIYENGNLVHSNIISNNGSQLFLALQIPIIILKKDL